MVELVKNGLYPLEFLVVYAFGQGLVGGARNYFKCVNWNGVVWVGLVHVNQVVDDNGVAGVKVRDVEHIEEKSQVFHAIVPFHAHVHVVAPEHIVYLAMALVSLH